MLHFRFRHAHILCINHVVLVAAVLVWSIASFVISKCACFTSSRFFLGKKMEAQEVGQTSLRPYFRENQGPFLHQPPLNRMDLRFLLNGSPPRNTGLIQEPHVPKFPTARTEPMSAFESQEHAVGKRTQKTEKDFGSTCYQAACSSPSPGRSKSSRVSLVLSPIVSESPGTESPASTTPTTVTERYSRESKRAHSNLSYGKDEKMHKSMKQLHSVSNAAGTRSSFSKRKTFPCEQCGFLFGMRSNLKRHVLTVHEDRRTFTCPICNSAFGLKQNLATHIRVKHEKTTSLRNATFVSNPLGTNKYCRTIAEIYTGFDNRPSCLVADSRQWQRNAVSKWTSVVIMQANCRHVTLSARPWNS